MAENESEQNQGQPPRSPGSGGGFVSLEDASDIALGHARDNQDFYGRRYRKRELAWEVLAQEEREDAYYIRLSFQPAQGFRGEPGVEAFIIGKSGPIQSRRVLSDPERRGGFPGCGLVAIVGVVGLVLLVEALSSVAL